MTRANPESATMLLATRIVDDSAPAAASYDVPIAMLLHANFISCIVRHVPEEPGSLAVSRRIIVTMNGDHGDYASQHRV
jgi:hypothetical protein